MAEPLVIHIQPVDAALVDYLAFLGPTLLVGPTPTPYISSANELISLGFDPSRKLYMRRRGVDVNQLSYTLGVAARLEVEDQENPPAPYPLGPDGPGMAP